ncbi:hypothetical protein HPP92_021664 [Vanilla planifolia]|uniref:Uncharacterized protein n=1 Tax=Vanilla planifolia TaxID=51239 RepID=A0A835Q639_VANPL|nr:hypothetical protein HPP92_021664 [Vanilla planifolia]
MTVNWKFLKIVLWTWKLSNGTANAKAMEQLLFSCIDSKGKQKTSDQTLVLAMPCDVARRQMVNREQELVNMEFCNAAPVLERQNSDKWESFEAFFMHAVGEGKTEEQHQCSESTFNSFQMLPVISYINQGIYSSYCNSMLNMLKANYKGCGVFFEGHDVGRTARK